MSLLMVSPPPINMRAALEPPGLKCTSPAPKAVLLPVYTENKFPPPVLLIVVPPEYVLLPDRYKLALPPPVSVTPCVPARGAEIVADRLETEITGALALLSSVRTALFPFAKVQLLVLVVLSRKNNVPIVWFEFIVTV